MPTCTLFHIHIILQNAFITSNIQRECRTCAMWSREWNIGVFYPEILCLLSALTKVTFRILHLLVYLVKILFIPSRTMNIYRHGQRDLKVKQKSSQQKANSTSPVLQSLKPAKNEILHPPIYIPSPQSYFATQEVKSSHWFRFMDLCNLDV